jgi:hypothetical protein
MEGSYGQGMPVQRTGCAPSIVQTRRLLNNLSVTYSNIVDDGDGSHLNSRGREISKTSELKVVICKIDMTLGRLFVAGDRERAW